MRLVDKYGGEIGDDVIAALAKSSINPELHSQAYILKTCGPNSVACNTGRALVMPKERSAVSLVGNIVHEVSHTMLGGGLNAYVQEEHEIRERVMTVWGQIPARLRVGGAYEAGYQWWRRDPRGLSCGE
jgi:hypothetical protein